MNRLLGQAFTVGVLAVMATAFAPACAENDKSIFIRGALAPSQTRQNGACVYTDDPTQAVLFEGVFDLAVRDNYIAVLLAGNQLIPRGDQNSVRAESNRAHINGAVVRVADPNGGVLGEFTSLATGFVETQNNNTPAFTSFSVTAIDAPTKNKIGASLAVGQTRLVTANIKVFGKTLGGVDLESGEYQLPIRVCNGCLISFASGDDPATPGVDCSLPLASSSSGGTTSLPCFPGQDETTPCQTCLDRPACRSR